MAKNIHGNDIYSMIIDIVMDLSPNQAEGLYAYLLPRYTTRARSKLYNADGEEDKNGKIEMVNLVCLEQDNYDIYLHMLGNM